MVDPAVKAYVDGEIAKESTSLNKIENRLIAVEHKPPTLPADFDAQVERVMKAVKAKAPTIPYENTKVGFQNMSFSGQFTKFDPTVLKYDEKGFTFMGRPLFPSLSMFKLEQTVEKKVKSWWGNFTGKTAREAAAKAAEEATKAAEERRETARKMLDLRRRLEMVFVRKTEAAALGRRVLHVEERLDRAAAAAGKGPAGGKRKDQLSSQGLRDTKAELDRLERAVRALSVALG